jgi:adenylosuccinate lyase
MIGRSNLQQAVPITFGYKMAALLAAMQRHRQRLSELLPRARDPHVKMFQQKVTKATKGLWFNSVESHEMVACLSSLRPSRSSVQRTLCVLLWPRTSNSEEAILNTML